MPKRKVYDVQSQLTLPFLASHSEVIEGIFNILEKKFGLRQGSNQHFIDLGSGDGSVVIYSAVNYKLRSFGIEINQELFKEAKGSIKRLNWKIKHNIRIMKGDLFQQNLEKFDFIYIFSLPSMHKFLLHVFRTAKKGAVIISYKYKLLNIAKLLKPAHEAKLNDINVFFYLKS